MKPAVDTMAAPPLDVKFATAPEAIAAVNSGQFVVVMDDEGRENEGDLIMAAEDITPAQMALIVRYTTGIIGAPMTKARAEELKLPRMVECNKNHACIFMWSLGNESGVGPTHLLMREWVNARDPTRPTHYEGLGNCHNGASEVISPMYAHPSHCVQLIGDGHDERPLLLCEYSHAMGNSNGGLAHYWELFRRHPHVQGGFIWDWCDQGLLQAAPDGTSRWAYGGDYGPASYPHDRQFCINGLTFPDRTPHPALEEVRYLQQPLHAQLDTSTLRLRLASTLDFVAFEALYSLSWELLRGGYKLAGGAFPLPAPLAPRRKANRRHCGRRCARVCGG